MDAAGDLEDGPIDLGSGWLALTYDRAADLPPSMRREAMTHGWPVESPDAYPVVERRDPDGVLRPLVERDVEIATACARSLGAFILKHAAMFSSDTFTPTCESYFDDDDLEVRFTVPHEAYSDFDLSAPVDDADADMEFDVTFDPEPPPAAPFRPRVARNAPCPCGSGRKYKKMLPAGRGGRARRSPRHPGRTRIGRTAGGPSHPLRDARIRRRLGSVQGRFPEPAHRRTAGRAVVGLRLRGGRPDGRRGVSRAPRPPLHGGRARLAERATRRLAVGVGSGCGRSGQDGHPARSAVRRAAHRAGKTRVADPGPP